MHVWNSCRQEQVWRTSAVVCKTKQLCTTKQPVGFPVCWDHLISLLQDCTLKKDLAAAKHLHLVLVSHGFESIPLCADHLIRLLALSDSLPNAQQAFARVYKPSIYTWNAILSAHVMCSTPRASFALYSSMLERDLQPDRVMLLSLLKVCDMTQTMILHHQIVSYGVEADAVVASALVNANAKNGALRDAYNLFKRMQKRDVVTWGTLMTAYIQHGYCHAALELYEEMQLEGVDPDRVIFLCILKACSQIGELTLGRLIHDEMIRTGVDVDLAVANTLIDLYARCASLEEACIVLQKLQNRDAVSWSALIAGYAQHGYDILVFKSFKRMQEESIKPSKSALLCVLKACINLAALAQGRFIHQHIVKNAFNMDLEIGNSLIDLYAKCGLPDEAYTVFRRLSKPDIVTWGALLAGYAQAGSYTLVLHFLKDMKTQGLMPNDVIFTSLLAACSRAGRIEEAQQYFKLMIVDYNFAPSIEHYSCLIDLFGRTGCLEEAQRFFEILPLSPDAVAWKSLLTSCRTHGSLNLGRRSFEQVVQLDIEDATNYVLMSKLCADSHMGEDANLLQEMRRSAHAWKVPGKAWLEIGDELVGFIIGGRDHEESDEIYGKFYRLGRFLRKDGHIPSLEAITYGKIKEDSLCKVSLQAHSG